jgi:hypothetical protein
VRRCAVDVERVTTDQPETQLETDPAGDPTGGPAAGRPVKPGHLPVSEILFSRAGAGSPFGDETAFPMSVADIDYELPDGHRYSDPPDEK